DEQVIQKRQVFIGGTSRAGKQLSFNGNNTNPVALFNGTNYLVVWINRDNEGRQAIHARRVAPGEVILDDQDIVIPSGGTMVVRVAWDGGNWLVASVQARANQGLCFASGGTRVVLNRISADGVPLDGEGVFLPAPEGFSASDVDVEWTGSRYLVAWTNRCVAFHTPTSTNVRAAFVSADLSDIDDFVVAPVITGTAYEVPRVATSAQQSLIAWSVGNTTQYRLISGVPAARRRRFGAAASAVDGRLLDVTHNPSGTFSLYLLGDPTFAAGIHGLFESVIFPGGTRTIPVFRFGYGFNEAIAGNVDDSLGFPRVVDMMLNGSFDPAAGAWRLWWREVPGER
ncbi:MAG TPA: hypothetical protein VJ901_14250, partial [Thermoanaerobaculia bacterium]|nr:hypothetical protein [Thermoanaerobaculia bacterium]